MYASYTVKYKRWDIQGMQTLGSSTMRIDGETKRDLVKIGAELSMKDGKERSLEDVVKYLIQEYKK